MAAASISAGKQRVKRLMQAQMEFTPAASGIFYVTSIERLDDLKIAFDPLNCNFSVRAPNQAWVSDLNSFGSSGGQKTRHLSTEHLSLRVDISTVGPLVSGSAETPVRDDDFCEERQKCTYTTGLERALLVA